MADVYQNLYNPDVLSCLANLSNDEVFTPPEVANRMLDMLPQELLRSPDTTFLDPACKSGVFLREIAKRLLVGLEDEIPDLQQRVDHIFHKQLYGIAITELTSLLSRRSVQNPPILPVSVFSTVAAFPLSTEPDALGFGRIFCSPARWRNVRSWVSGGYAPGCVRKTGHSRHTRLTRVDRWFSAVPVGALPSVFGCVPAHIPCPALQAFAHKTAG